jgi:hypothetical protein
MDVFAFQLVVTVETASIDQGHKPSPLRVMIFSLPPAPLPPTP